MALHSFEKFIFKFEFKLEIVHTPIAVPIRILEVDLALAELQTHLCTSLALAACCCISSQFMRFTHLWPLLLIAEIGIPVHSGRLRDCAAALPQQQVTLPTPRGVSELAAAGGVGLPLIERWRCN